MGLRASVVQGIAVCRSDEEVHGERIMSVWDELGALLICVRGLGFVALGS